MARGGKKAKRQAESKLKLRQKRAKAKQQPAHDDHPATPPPLPSSRCLPPASTAHLVSSSTTLLQYPACDHRSPRRFARRLICERNVRCQLPARAPSLSLLDTQTLCVCQKPAAAQLSAAQSVAAAVIAARMQEQQQTTVYSKRKRE